AISKHGNVFDYSLVDYKNCDTPVIIKCSIHGDFLQTPYSHLTKKHGCRKCAFIEGGNKTTKSTEHFIQKATTVHGDT
ncbi:DUF723 domain-containing protein, partial [Escherichia coli]|uniref:DUF723 domain-containing protein n=1 Tax=Escherichia coli TaxID=562 RepID=UPI0021DABCA3